MNIDVYCDEAYPDLLSSQDKPAKYMFIGNLWLKSEDRARYKAAIHQLRDHYKIGGEFKWQKVSPSRLDFYKALLSWFVEQGDDLRFRCIAIDSNQVDLLKYHENDQELGFYKFYYQVLHHWIHDCNDYQVFCDQIRFRKRDFNHAFFESVSTPDDTFSVQRAERVDWIKAALLDPNSERRVGWDRNKKRLDFNRRVAIVMGNFVVVIRIDRGRQKGWFRTAYVADRGRTLALIKRGPLWT